MKTQAVCTRGHVVARDVVNVSGRQGYDTQPLVPRYYEIDQYCTLCGASVILACPSCDTPIPNPRATLVMPGARPFCGRCGSLFPWATRQERIERLVTVLDEQGDLDEPSRLAAVEAIQKLAATEPDDEDAQVESASRVRNIVGKAWEFMRPVAQTMMTEAAKRQLELV